MDINVKAAVILLSTLFLGVGLGAVGEGALVNARNSREQDLRRPPGFVAHMEDVIGPHDSAQASAVRSYLEQTARQNDSIMRVAQDALRNALDSMVVRLDPLLDATQRDRLKREAASPPPVFGPGGRGRGRAGGPPGRDGFPPRARGGPPPGRGVRDDGRRGGPPPGDGQFDGPPPFDGPPARGPPPGQGPPTGGRRGPPPDSQRRRPPPDSQRRRPPPGQSVSTVGDAS